MPYWRTRKAETATADQPLAAAICQTHLDGTLVTEERERAAAGQRKLERARPRAAKCEHNTKDDAAVLRRAVACAPRTSAVCRRRAAPTQEASRLPSGSQLGGPVGAQPPQPDERQACGRPSPASGLELLAATVLMGQCEGRARFCANDDADAIGPSRALTTRRSTLDDLLGTTSAIMFRCRQHSFDGQHVYLMEAHTGLVRGTARLAAARAPTAHELGAHATLLDFMGYKTVWAWPLSDISKIATEWYISKEARRYCPIWIPRARWERFPA